MLRKSLKPMDGMMKYVFVFSVPVVFFLWPACASAQMEINQERSSLHGLKGVGFAVNLEQNTVFADTNLVKITAIRKGAKNILRKSHIHLYSDAQVRKSTRIPVLFLHINMLSTRTGIISFAVIAKLIQPVRLVLNHNKPITAATWQDSEVGIASYQKISVIKRAAMGLVRSFINDYNQAN